MKGWKEDEVNTRGARKTAEEAGEVEALGVSSGPKTTGREERSRWMEERLEVRVTKTT